MKSNMPVSPPAAQPLNVGGAIGAALTTLVMAGGNIPAAALAAGKQVLSMPQSSGNVASDVLAGGTTTAMGGLEAMVNERLQQDKLVNKIKHAKEYADAFNATRAVEEGYHAEVNPITGDTAMLWSTLPEQKGYTTFIKKQANLSSKITDPTTQAVKYTSEKGLPQMYIENFTKAAATAQAKKSLEEEVAEYKSLAEAYPDERTYLKRLNNDRIKGKISSQAYNSVRNSYKSSLKDTELRQATLAEDNQIKNSLHYLVDEDEQGNKLIDETISSKRKRLISTVQKRVSAGDIKYHTSDDYINYIDDLVGKVKL
jgi:hypothetical protein